MDESYNFVPSKLSNIMKGEPVPQPAMAPEPPPQRRSNASHRGKQHAVLSQAQTVEDQSTQNRGSSAMQSQPQPEDDRAPQRTTTLGVNVMNIGALHGFGTQGVGDGSQTMRQLAPRARVGIAGSQTARQPSARTRGGTDMSQTARQPSDGKQGSQPTRMLSARARVVTKADGSRTVRQPTTQRKQAGVDGSQTARQPSSNPMGGADGSQTARQPSYNSMGGPDGPQTARHPASNSIGGADGSQNVRQPSYKSFALGVEGSQVARQPIYRTSVDGPPLARQPSYKAGGGADGSQTACQPSYNSISIGGADGSQTARQPTHRTKISLDGSQLARQPSYKSGGGADGSQMVRQPAYNSISTGGADGSQTARQQTYRTQGGVDGSQIARQPSYNSLGGIEGSQTARQSADRTQGGKDGSQTARQPTYRTQAGVDAPQIARQPSSNSGGGADASQTTRQPSSNPTGGGNGSQSSLSWQSSSSNSMGGAAEGSQLTRQLSSKASSISNSHPTSSSVPHASISRLNLDFTTSSTQLQPKPKPQPEPSNGGVGNPRLSRLKAPPVPSSNNPPVSPVSPAYALKHHAGDLSPYEQSEILDYQKIYFTGPNANKAELCGESNHGFDDERGDYINVMHDHLCFRFQIMSIVGKGSFGQVMKCFDYKTNQFKAVKVIRNKKRFHQQALVEVKLLDHLKQHDPDDAANIVHMHEYFYFRDHLCISFELLSLNLYEFIKNNNFQGLSLGLIRRFGQQLLISLKYLRRHKIIHCDLKPENILLKAPSKSSIKMIDFGSSCFEDERVYTYIQSRFYRSPEVILGSGNTG